MTHTLFSIVWSGGDELPADPRTLAEQLGAEIATIHALGRTADSRRLLKRIDAVIPTGVSGSPEFKSAAKQVRVWVDELIRRGGTDIRMMSSPIEYAR